MEEKTKKVWSMGKILLGKLELNMYLDIRFCVKWLPFSFFLICSETATSEMLPGSECSRGICGIRREAQVPGSIF